MSSSSLSGGGTGTKEVEEEAETTLNIFSLASGHLYERLLRYVTMTTHPLYIDIE